MVMAPGGNLGANIGNIKPANIGNDPLSAANGIIFPDPTGGAAIFYNSSTKNFSISTNGIVRWLVDQSGNMFPGSDAAQQFGMAGARPGTSSFGAALSIGGLLTAIAGIASNGAILMGTDNAFDIGDLTHRPKGIVVGDDQITISSNLKTTALGGAVGLTITGFRQIGGLTGSVPTLPALKGTAPDGPTSGPSGWLYVIMNGFSGGWIPVYT